MALKHGINTYKDDTGIVSVQTADVGIPFFIGAAPCHRGKGFTGKPQLANNFAEAEELLGYSTDWRKADGSPAYSLCQAMYAFHKLMGMSPAIYYNVYNPAKHKKSVSAEQITVKDHIAELPADALDDSGLTVTATAALVKGTDYDVYYTDNALCVEILPDSAAYSESTVSIAYNIADLTQITSADIEEAVEAVEQCRSVVGIVPDLLAAPGGRLTRLLRR